jgi:hypothetical protein
MRYEPNPNPPPNNPNPYPAYEPDRIGLLTKLPLAGDPGRFALRLEPGVYPTNGRLQYWDSSGQQVAIAVTYRYGSSGTKRTIIRQIDWPYTAPATSTDWPYSTPTASTFVLSAAANTASREIGRFTDPDNVLKVTFTNKDMQLIGRFDTAVVVKIESSPDSRHPENKSVLNDTVYLREATFK